MQDKNNTSQTVQSESLQDFADKLLGEMNLENVDSETIGQMRKDIIDRLERVTNKVAVESLSPEKLFEFEKMIDNNEDASKIQAYIEQNVPDLSEKLTKAYIEFSKLYLGKVS